MKKVVVISGGASGIGLATAEKFYTEGYRVIVVDIKPMINGCFESFQCDLQDIASLEKVMQEVVALTGRIDALVPAAGVHLSASITNTSVEDFYRVLNTNFTSCFFLMKIVLPVMQQQQSGAIVLVSSEQALVGKPSSAIYGATKGALAQLAKSAALDYAADNIRVNCVCPGTIDTTLYQNAVERYSERSGVMLETAHQEEAALQPLGRVGKAKEVAESIYFLAAEKSSFTTGALLVVDGGYTAR